jgi:hypothetical protein
MRIEPLESRRLMSTSPSVDAVFGPVLIDVPGGDDYGQALVSDADGRIIVGGRWTGETPQPGRFQVFLSRHHGSGRLDQRFGTNGISLLSPHGMGEVIALRQQPDGKLLALGSRRDDLGSDVRFHLILARLTVSGKIDGSFGDNGAITIGTPGRSDFRGAISDVTADGKVIVAVAYASGEQDWLMQL